MVHSVDGRGHRPAQVGLTQSNGPRYGQQNTIVVRVFCAIARWLSVLPAWAHTSNSRWYSPFYVKNISSPGATFVLAEYICGDEYIRQLCTCCALLFFCSRSHPKGKDNKLDGIPVATCAMNESGRDVESQRRLCRVFGLWCVSNTSRPSECPIDEALMAESREPDEKAILWPPNAGMSGANDLFEGLSKGKCCRVAISENERSPSNTWRAHPRPKTRRGAPAG